MGTYRELIREYKSVLTEEIAREERGLKDREGLDMSESEGRKGRVNGDKDKGCVKETYMTVGRGGR